MGIDRGWARSPRVLARALLIIGTAVFALAVPTAATGAPTATPRTLTGEVLSGRVQTRPHGDCLAGFEVANGRVDFVATGTATGPYPGTFVEAGRATLTTTADPSNATVSWRSAFTITSRAGRVVGVKRFEGTATEFIADCDVLPPSNFDGLAIVGRVRYTATIFSTDGRWIDRGLSPTASVLEGNSFENFQSDLTAPQRAGGVD